MFGSFMKTLIMIFVNNNDTIVQSVSVNASNPKLEKYVCSMIKITLLFFKKYYDCLLVQI